MLNTPNSYVSLRFIDVVEENQLSVVPSDIRKAGEKPRWIGGS